MWITGNLERRLRSISGVVVAVFVVLHLLNHSAAIHSLAAAEYWRALAGGLWGSLPGTVLLYGALAVHGVTAMLALYRRRSLRMSWWEGVQILLGLSIMPLLAAHVLATRGLAEWFDVPHDYARIALVIWSSDTVVIKQTLLLLVVWGHLLVGLHFWLRVYEWYRRFASLWRLLAVLLPAFALIGFARAGQQVARLAQDKSAVADLLAGFGRPLPELAAFVNSNADRALQVYVVVLLLVLAARQIRQWWRGRRAAFELLLPDGTRVPGAHGATMLDALRAERVPHASVCGGRGRCTTCRVRIGVGEMHVPEPSAVERQALARIGAPPNVRLACQARPHGMVPVTPLLAATAGASAARQPGGVSGREQTVTAMFLDLRGSTALGEKKLPYDVLFILNQFFAEMAGALAATEGHYAQFAGDGLMALYGLEGQPERGAANAIRGARLMLQRLESLNQRLAEEMEEPLRIGIGVHTGEAIVGTMGPPRSPNYSAIGDNINIAARLEAANKLLSSQVIISAACMRLAGLDPERFRHQEVDVRGRDGDILVCVFDGLDDLP